MELIPMAFDFLYKEIYKFPSLYDKEHKNYCCQIARNTGFKLISRKLGHNHLNRENVNGDFFKQLWSEVIVRLKEIDKKDFDEMEDVDYEFINKWKHINTHFKNGIEPGTVFLNSDLQLMSTIAHEGPAYDLHN